MKRFSKYPTIQKILAALPQLQHEKTPQGLLIKLRPEERNEVTPDSDMYDVFEHMMANSGLEWLAPEEIGALTDAPIIGETRRDDHGNIEELYEVYWYPEYETKNPVAELIDKGEVLFRKAD